MTKLLVDGIFFQLNNTGIARVWASLLPRLVASGEFEILFLDRGAAPRVDGVSYVPFPRQHNFSDTAADSILIQKVCDHYGADVFTSTYYTTPLRTPMLLLVYDMIPELFGFDLTQRAWMEKDAAISYAQRYLCISRNTRHDLLSLYPEIDPASVAVGYCGVDEKQFYPRSKEDIAALRKRYGLARPYFLFVGSRVQHTGYKNSRLFFDALARMTEAEFDVFCVGGEEQIEPEILATMPAGVRCQRVQLTDDELAAAYGGAAALVYPSLYEGFGMPVIEAMASGCPVITTHHGSLAEAAGDAACLIGGTSVDEMRGALHSVQRPGERERLIAAGLAQAARFNWSQMTAVFAAQCARLRADADTGRFAEFFDEWSRLRLVQASVDYA